MGNTSCKQNGTYSMAMLENGGRDDQDHAADVEQTLAGNGNLQTESQPSRGCKRLALILSLTALLTCLVVLLYVTVVFATQFTPRGHNKHFMVFSRDQMSFQEVCLDCQRLVKNPYIQFRNDPVVEGLKLRKEGNVLKCCAENRVQISAMLKAVARRQDKIKDVFPAAFKDMQKSSAVFVHKQMISETWNSLTGYSVVKFDPSNNQGLREQRRGATILEDGIVILKTGTYYIYSNVFFSVNETGKASSNQKWSSHVHRTSPQWNSRTGILLTSVTQQTMTASFTGGVFPLQSGDFIQVFLSDVGLVHFNRKSSYFGLVMVSTCAITRDYHWAADTGVASRYRDFSITLFSLTNYSCKVAGLPGRVLAAFSVSPNTLLVDVSTRELEAVRVTPVTYESMKPVAQKAMANY